MFCSRSSLKRRAPTMVDKNPTSQAKSSRKELPLWGSMLLLISAIVACSIGGVFMRKFWHERQTGKESLNWPQTEGVVTKCEYHHSRRGGNARISYRYAVGGKAYSSAQVDVAKDYLLNEPKAFWISIRPEQRFRFTTILTIRKSLCSCPELTRKTLPY